ncbi:low temperature requirement protein A [Embleya sp. MST-111070]|uniref:low temperature requirement protein A n=1 Tax=Embleya sp. MST-111070 TaxID=3398231 RepID=UPI003F73DE88
MPPAADEYRIRKRMTGRAADEPHRTASPLELLFDLTFVIAVAAVTAQYAHGIAGGHVLSGLVPFLEVFFAVWWAWMNFTWFASSYDTDDIAYRVLTMVQMAGVPVLAAGIPATGADTDLRLVTTGYVVMRVALVAQWLRAAVEHPAGRRTAVRYAAGVALLQVGWIVRLALDEAQALPSGAEIPSFAALALLELCVPWWAERVGGTAWHPHHIAERYGLFTLILFGESVLAVSNGVRTALDTADVGGETVVMAGSGLVLLFTLWWLYFRLPAGRGLVDRREASYLWGYGHYGVFAGLAALGAGLEVAVEQSGHRLAASPLAIGYAVTIPTAVVVVLLQVIHSPIVPEYVMRPRALSGAVAAVLLLPSAAPHVGVTAVVGALAAVGVAMVVATLPAVTRQR